MHADNQLIEHVIVNLLNNAVKYAPDSKEIRIQIDRLSDAAKVSVRDFGPGIPQDKKDRLFERYYQAQDSGREFSGLGLGLFICSEIIENMAARSAWIAHQDKAAAFGLRCRLRIEQFYFIMPFENLDVFVFWRQATLIPVN